MKKKSIFILLFLFSLIFSGSAKANYYLIIGRAIWIWISEIL